MKRLIGSAFLAFGCISSFANETRENALLGLIQAEQAFAALAVKANTREAFLTYLADDAIMFSNGPSNGKKLYAANQADESLLTWEPVFADVAASGDFGYDTGPYSHRQKRTDEKPQRQGQFVTIWKKLPTGEWRVAFDTGYSHPAPASAIKPALQTGTSDLSQGQPPGTPDEARASLLAAERALIAGLKQDGVSAYKNALSTSARRLYRGQFPAVNRAAFLTQADQSAKIESLSYELIEGAVASSGDLGYVYGWLDWQKSSPENTPKRVNYLRIWKRENGRDWNLVLELTGPG